MDPLAGPCSQYFGRYRILESRNDNIGHRFQTFLGREEATTAFVRVCNPARYILAKGVRTQGRKCVWRT